MISYNPIQALMSIKTIILFLSILAKADENLYENWNNDAYCNDLNNMDTNAITPLTDEQLSRVESLEQVQILARHGARAPYYRVFCWDKSKIDPVNANWQCTTTSVSSQDIGYAESGYGRLYRKNYIDGLNILTGNCPVGGLLPLGRKQHLKNGKMLHESYVGDGPMKLFPRTKLSDLPLHHIYLRSDDQERTIGSGQALLDGFFAPDPSSASDVILDKMLVWHTADYVMDYINANDGICPRLTIIEKEGKTSQEMMEYQQSHEYVKTTDKFTQAVGKFSYDTALECLSIARCNNLPLPSDIDEELFEDVINAVEKQQAIVYLYNNSEYSKLAMQPLANEWVSNLQGMVTALQEANANYSGTAEDFISTSPRLSVTMGHDTTIMPFLAAILRENWDKKWTPYAATLVLELYRLKDTDTMSFAARLLFQGKPLRVPECSDDLCDLDTFLEAFHFAKHPRAPEECFSPAVTYAAKVVQHAQPITVTSSTNQSTFSFVGIIAIGTMILAIVFLSVKQYKQNQRNDQYTLLA